MARLLTGVATALLVIATPAASQNVPSANMAGTWAFSFETPEASERWRMTFEQVADTLKGSAETEYGTVPLSGVVEGDQIFFGLTVTYQGEPYDLVFEGKASEETAEGTIDVTGADIQMVFDAERDDEP